MREAKKVECGPRRRSVTPTRALEPEVYEASFGRMKFQFIPAKSLTQHVQQQLAGQMVLEGDHWSSRPGESHPQALTEPDVSVAAHPALIVQPLRREAQANVRRA